MPTGRHHMRYPRQGEQFNISQAQSTGILWDQRPSILLLIVNDVINPNRNPWASKAHLAGIPWYSLCRFDD